GHQEEDGNELGEVVYEAESDEAAADQQHAAYHHAPGFEALQQPTMDGTQQPALGAMKRVNQGDSGSTPAKLGHPERRIYPERLEEEQRLHPLHAHGTSHHPPAVKHR